MRRFAPGSPVALRELWGGRVWTVRPAVVVEDEPDQLAFCVFPGTRWKAPARRNGTPLRLPEPDWRLIDRLWAGSTILSFAWPETLYAVLLWFEQGTGVLERFYVNLQEPLRRTDSGFDTVDHVLDAVVEPDRSAWRWKDERELAEAVARGLFTPQEEASFREQGERAVRRIVDGEPPFDRDWSGWEPEATWPIPRLPSGWDEAEP
jgi:predicted RNA-binding protein associated with RNAse of E/G family